MIKSIKIISSIIVIICIIIQLGYRVRDTYDKSIQNKIINNVFNVKNNNDNDYLGYIYIPKYDIKRLIKKGTDSDILDNGYVGLHHLSGDLESHDLIILAGHNIPTVFNYLHKMSINDEIYIRGKNFNRKFVIYDKVYVDEYNTSYFNKRNDELLLITCTSNKGERLLVLLKEEK